MTNVLSRLLRRPSAPAPAGPARDVTLDDAELRSRLTRKQYNVLRRASTEVPFSGEYVHTHDDGVYRCAACKAALFNAGAKFDSGTGWPSFDRPVGPESVELHRESSLVMRRTEVLCRACGSHLGHVFGDGPTVTRDRFCINSCALDLDRDA